MLRVCIPVALWAALGLAACAPAPAGAQAGATPNLLVIGEDEDEDTVPRNSRVFDRVLRVIQDKMNESGFNVFDETAVTLGTLAQDRVRRDDGEIIEVCRAVSAPPLDVAVIFSIWPDTRRSEVATYVSARVDGRMLNCRTGQVLGAFEQKFETQTLPTRCGRSCVLEAVGERARVIGRNVAHALALKLAWLVEAAGTPPDPVVSGGGGSALPTQFEIVLDNFTASEVQRAEEYMVAFDGYRGHRLIDSSPTRARFWYETASGDAKLRRNLTSMLGIEEVEAVVGFSGNTFTVEKIGRRTRE